MINLKAIIGGLTYESIEISHPAQSGTSGIDYIINHNKGRSADNILMYVKYISSGGNQWRLFYDFESAWTSGSGWGYQGYYTLWQDQTDDSAAIRVFRIGSGNTEKIKFKFTWY